MRRWWWGWRSGRRTNESDVVHPDVWVGMGWDVLRVSVSVVIEVGVGIGRLDDGVIVVGHEVGVGRSDVGWAEVGVGSV